MKPDVTLLWLKQSPAVNLCSVKPIMSGLKDIFDHFGLSISCSFSLPADNVRQVAMDQRSIAGQWEQHSWWGPIALADSPNEHQIMEHPTDFGHETS